MKYNPALDGLRAITVIAVVAFHTSIPFAKGGMIGVDVFFVLSGYLITTILRNELARSSAIDLRRFYLRRAIRLVPALVLAMSGTFIFYRIARPDIDIVGDAIASLLYISDYRNAFSSAEHTIAHTWSLSVEAKFYIIWPVFLILTRKLPDKRLLTLLSWLFVAATLWRYADALIWNDWRRTYFRFDTRTSGMILGAALAVSQWSLNQEQARKISAYSLYLLAILCVALRWEFLPSLEVGVTLAELATAGLIVSLTSGHVTAVSQWLSKPQLVYIGTLSYSIYLWHYGMALAVRDEVNPVAAFSITILFATAMAAMSYKLVETPLSERGRRILSANLVRTK